MTLINDKKLSALYGDTQTNPTCHLLDEKEFNNSIVGFLEKGLKEGYSKTYVAGEILNLINNYPEYAEAASLPTTYEGVMQQLIQPLYPKYQNPVYQCIRPLAIPWLDQQGKKTGSELEENPLYHQYSCINPKEKYSQLICLGLTTNSKNHVAGNGVGQLETYSVDECTFVADDRCISDCIEEEWLKEKPDYTLVGLGTNCQEYDNNIHEVCHDRCKE
ncbi:hypothetical protein K1X76_09340 [bacterium]|nr:hypothetical protein [bacterium]